VIRGLLCAGCNSWLGKRRDDLAMLRRAVAWLERGEQRAADPEWTMRVKERSSSPASDG
jgi:hypothetical protein